MKKLMHKVIDAGKYVRYVPVNGLQAYRKLGELEDLMEQNNIDSVEELSIFLKGLNKYCIKEQDYNCENNTYGNECITIYLDEDDEEYKIVKKVLWGAKHEK